VLATSTKCCCQVEALAGTLALVRQSPDFQYLSLTLLAGAGLVVPKITKPLERKAWFRATFKSFVVNFFLFDLCESLAKLAPSAASPAGASIFISHLPPVQRYIVSTAIHVITGLTFIVGFGTVHDLCALVDVFVLGHSPEDWPPLFDAPWCATSVSEFWSRRWHQTMRPALLDLGGYPLQWLLSPFGKTARRFGLVIGSFLASGILHDFGMWNMQREFVPDALLFFGLQGLAVCAENVLHRITGRRVGGWPGLVWTYALIVIGGQPMSECPVTSPRAPPAFFFFSDGTPV